MTSRERVKKTLDFASPDRVPRNLWRLPGTEMYRRKDVEHILELYPQDIVTTLHGEVPGFVYARGNRSRGARYKAGETAADEWGCEWHVAEDGVAGEVKQSPTIDLAEIQHLTAPYEVLEQTDFSPVDRFCAKTNAFVLAYTTVRPFERMQFLLGTERLFIELHSLPQEIFRLRDVVHEFFIEELRLWVATGVDGILFMDDWGSQQGLLISPMLWRSFFEPLYGQYCDLIHSHNKYVFFHSDGNIEAIYPDLIALGVDAINSQLFCMNIEELGRKYRGKLTFYGEIDRQYVLPFGTKEGVTAAVKRLKDALWLPEGGIIAQCEFGLKDPVENIQTVFETWGLIS
jgi:hypothetical protein